MSSQERAAAIPCLLGLALAAILPAQSLPQEEIQRLLPPGARIMETADVRLTNGAGRALVLWMSNPERVVVPQDHWTCFEFVVGDHWYGPASLSLIDTTGRKLINTVPILPEFEDPGQKGAFPIPFSVSGGPYYVPHPDADKKGKPLILRLRDLTGEGVAGQFELFDHETCVVYESSVFGYSPKTDRAVHYPIEVTTDRFRPVVESWVMSVFSAAPASPGRWEVESALGHGSQGRIHDSVRFDPGRQMFVDRQTTKPYPLVADAYCSLEVKEVPELLRLIGLITPGFDDQQKAGIVSLIKGSAVDDLVATMAFVKYQGESTQLDVEWQTGGDGRILMSFTTNACLAASMQRRIHAWCGAKRIPILGWCKAK